MKRVHSVIEHIPGAGMEQRAEATKGRRVTVVTFIRKQTIFLFPARIYSHVVYNYNFSLIRFLTLKHALAGVLSYVFKIHPNHL